MSLVLYLIVCIFHQVLLSIIHISYSSSQSLDPLKIGIIYSNDTIFLSPYLRTTETLFRLHLQRYSNNEILGRPIEFVNETIWTSPSFLELSNATQKLIVNHSPDVILCQVVGYGCEDAANQAGIISFTGPGEPFTSQCVSSIPLSQQPPCPHIGARRYPLKWELAANTDAYFNNFIGIIKIKGAKTLAILANSAMPMFVSGLGLLARDNRIDFKVIYYTHGFLTPTAPEVIANVTQQLIASNPDAVIFTETNCDEHLVEWEKFNYFPPAVGAMTCIDENSYAEQTIGANKLKYVSGPTPYSDKSIGSEYTETMDHPAPFYPVSTNSMDHLTSLPSSLQFGNEFRSLFNYTPTCTDAAPLAALQMWEIAMKLSNTTTDMKQITASLNAMYESSFYGVLSADGFGVNQQHNPPFAQRDINNQIQIVSPLSSASADFVFPAPKWSERIYELRMYSKREEIVLIIIAVIVSACILALMVALYYHREHPEVKATTPWISVVMGVGGVTSCVGGILTWSLENNSTTCSTRLWIWTTGFHLFIGPLIAKTQRIAHIFNQDRLQAQGVGKHVKARLALYALIPFIPQLIMNLVWYLFDPPRPRLSTPDPLRPAYNYVECASDYTYVLAPLSFAYSLFLLLISCYLAYRIRNAYRVFNDTKSIILSIYIFAVTATVIGVVQFSVSGQRSVLFIIRSTGVVVAYGLALSILFVSRIRAAYQSVNIKNSSLDVNSALPQDKRELLRYKAENEMLRSKLAQFERAEEMKNSSPNDVHTNNTGTFDSCTINCSCQHQMHANTPSTITRESTGTISITKDASPSSSSPP